MLEGALSDYEKAGGPKGPVPLLAKLALARALGGLGRHAAAAELFQEGARIFRHKGSAAEGARLVRRESLQSWAESLLACGRFSEAAGVARALLELLFREFGPWHEWTLRARKTLGESLCSAGQWENGLWHLREVRDASRSQGRLAELAELQCLYAIALAKRRLGKLDSAAGGMEALVKKARRACGPNCHGEFTATGQLGELWLEKGAPQMAAEFFQRALIIAKSAGPDANVFSRREVLGAEFNLARALEASGRGSEAAELLARVLEAESLLPEGERELWGPALALLNKITGGPGGER